MVDEAAFEKLQSEVQYLKDRQDILDCINRHARGHDRHDNELITNAYHDDGVDEHGPDINPAKLYADWANGVHRNSDANMHNITTHNCEIDGNLAFAESYCLVGLLVGSREMVTLLNGRYVDELEKRDGIWRITKRRTTLDFACTGDARIMAADQMKGYIKGARDHDDISYQRPVEINSASPRW